MEIRTLSFQTMSLVVKYIQFILLPAAFIYLIGICIYRIFFHPLAGYPGPLLAKITDYYAVYHAWKGDIHTDLWICHERFGKHLRYGPNKLAFYTTESLKDIHSHSSNVKKPRGYNAINHQTPNTLTLRDKDEHSGRKRVLSQGFSDSALRVFEPKILALLDRFCTSLIGIGDNRVSNKWSAGYNMSKWFHYLVFDTIMDVTFSTSYDTLGKPDYRYVIKSMEESNLRLSVLMYAPELTFAKLDHKLFPKAIIAKNQFLSFIKKLLDKRLRSSNAEFKDIFSFMQYAKDPITGDGLSHMQLCAETAILIVAGSGTTSTAMVAMIFYLSHNSAAYDSAATEIRRTFSCVLEIRYGAQLASCVYLRNCIDETPRMSPPVGGPLWREIQTDGATIDGEFVPEGCDVGVDLYAIHHNSEYYTRPFEYKPERWKNRKDAVDKKHEAKRAFTPFSMRPRSCVSQSLAMMEIMLTMATIFMRFDFRAVEDDQAKAVDSKVEFRMKDNITGVSDGPVIQFRPRQNCWE